LPRGVAGSRQPLKSIVPATHGLLDQRACPPEPASRANTARARRQHRTWRASHMNLGGGPDRILVDRMARQSRNSNTRAPRAARTRGAREVPPAKTIRLRMPSRRDAVSPTVERILRAVSPVGLTRDQRDDLAVALAEALSNAAVHGNRLRPDSHVSIAIR